MSIRCIYRQSDMYFCVSRETFTSITKLWQASNSKMDDASGGGKQETQISLDVADFFCGAGGFSLGFQQAGFNIVYGVDKNVHAMSTYTVSVLFLGLLSFERSELNLGLLSA